MAHGQVAGKEAHRQRGPFLETSRSGRACGTYDGVLEACDGITAGVTAKGRALCWRNICLAKDLQSQVQAHALRPLDGWRM